MKAWSAKKILSTFWPVLVMVVLFAIFFNMWLKAGGSIEIDSKGDLRFDSLIALFTGFAFVGAITSILIQGSQFTQSIKLQYRATESAEKAAMANLTSVKQAKASLWVQKEIALKQEIMARRQLRAQYLLLAIEEMKYTISATLDLPDTPETRKIIDEANSKRKIFIEELRLLPVEVPHHEQAPDPCSQHEPPTNS